MAIESGVSVNTSDRVSTALPAAAATATPATPLDLGAAGGRQCKELWLQLRVPAAPNLANGKLCTFTVTDCDTAAGSYTAVEGYGNLTRTGAGGVGAAEKSWQMRLHRNVRRYVKITAAVEAAGGDNTAVSFVQELVLEY